MSDAELRAEELDSSNEYETELILAEAYAKRGDTVGATLHTFLAKKNR